jgi:hypothetical protein
MLVLLMVTHVVSLNRAVASLHDTTMHATDFLGNNAYTTVPKNVKSEVYLLFCIVT